jgi:hypothetical protein
VDYVFDTSAINRLHDDLHRNEIVAGVIAANHVFVSELNLVEVMTTRVETRRISLVLLMKQLARGVMPLLTPTTLLKKLTIACLDGQSSPAITSDETAPEAWRAMQHPEKFLDEDARQGFYEEKQNIEKRFTHIHRVARTELPDIFPTGQRPKSFGQAIRFFCRNPLSLFATTAAVYKGVTGRNIDLDGMRQLFIDVPEWPLFLAGWAQGLYSRALQELNYGARTNVGTVDLWFALYLEHCDFLVTDDRLQYKALRVINVLAQRRRPRANVLLYDQFRRRLVL